MSIERTQLTDDVKFPFGKAEVFVGDAFVVGGMEQLGVIEGDVVASITKVMNNLTFPEYTGEGVHDQEVTTSGVSVKVPVLITNEAQLAKLTPTNDLDLGSDTFRKVVPRQVLIISQNELSEADGMSYNGAIWTPAPPENALWIWKAVLTADTLTWGHSDRGKRYTEVTITAMFDATKPAKNKFATFGNPVAKGMPTIRL